MYKRLANPKFGIRSLLVVVAIAAVSVWCFQKKRSSGAALLQSSAELKQYRIFALEKSQIGESHFVEFQPFDSPKKSKAEVPVFQSHNPSMIRSLVGDELFVNYEAVVIDLAAFPIEELETRLAKLGDVSKIYCTVNSGFEEKQLERLRRRFPETEVVKLALLPDLRALEMP